jgi:hypothetical protein
MLWLRHQNTELTMRAFIASATARRCAGCLLWLVARQQEFTPLLRQPTPSFEDIANRPTTTEKSLREFLRTTHLDNKSLPMTMPDPMLIPKQRLALARYILSLRTQE